MNDLKRIKKIRCLSSKELFNKIVFFGILMIVLVVSTICLVNALKWVNKPFPGFLLNERMLVAPIGQYHWTGTQAGLKYPDKILKANGVAVTSTRELEDVIKHMPIGNTITYSVQKGDQVIEVPLSTMRFTWIDLLMTFASTFIPGIIYMLIGVIVFIMKPNTKISWAFLIACFFLSLWSITVFDMQSTHYGFIRLYIFAAAFFPAAFVHFSLYFPKPQKLILKYPNLEIIPYLISFVIIIPLELLYPQEKHRIFYNLALIYMILGSLAVLYPVVVAYFKPISVLSRQRAKVVLLGGAIAFPIPALAYFSQLQFGSFLGMRIHTNFLALPLLIFPVSIAYAIAKHNLFDVDVYIKRAVGYGIITSIIVGAYALVSVFLNVLLGKYQIAQSRAFPVLFILGIILIFNPLRNRIQAFVDRVFFRKEYDYGDIIERIGGAMTSLLDLGQILSQLVGTFIEDMFIDTSSIMLLNPAKTEYQACLAMGENDREVGKVVLKKEEPLIQIIEGKKKEVTIFDVLEDPKYQTISEKCSKVFKHLNAILMVPLIFQNELIGFLNLGRKKSGKFYSREDIELIHTLANQGAVAIKNAKLFQESLEKQRMEEELSIARDLQTSMLPATCPTIKGFDIAALSIPAREVGGDFFDFIDMEKNKLGFVIGDVTGKGVSGALIMAASRSVFRMLSEEKLNVGGIMIRANQRLKKDIKKNMFVALLYGVLDTNDRSLRLCNAGQMPPIYFSQKTGKADFVKTEGDTFPLGIIDKAEYQDTSLMLQSGDKVVFCTDGIVEALNNQNKMFSFERLLNVVQESRSLTAEALLKDIIDNVKEFAGDTAQYDDMTIIVLQVAELKS